MAVSSKQLAEQVWPVLPPTLRERLEGADGAWAVEQVVGPNMQAIADATDPDDLRNRLSARTRGNTSHADEFGIGQLADVIYKICTLGWIMLQFYDRYRSREERRKFLARHEQQLQAEGVPIAALEQAIETLDDDGQ